MILYTCELKSDFSHSHKRRKEMILQTYGLISDFFIHISAEKNDIAHLWALKWFFSLTQEKKNDIARLWPIYDFFIHIIEKEK
jgi:hypothetical protein